jgi:ERCC4-type nuclease
MKPGPAMLIVAATKPRGKPARMLAEAGIAIVPIEEDEGNVDRYLLSKRLAIERRTGSGFLRGIQDRTLFTSAIYLREHFGLPVLIMEGEVDYRYSSFDPQAVRGALSSMMLQYGVNVLAAPDVEETVALIAMMARQEQLGIPEISLIPKRKATDLADMQRRIVEMFPGCGMVAARDLLQRFGSVKRVVNASEDRLASVRGIGAKTAARIHQVLNAEYESVDTERHLEDAVEAAPELLFDQPVTLVARQHCIYVERGERHVVDLVFLDRRAHELVLVELKRGRIAPEHHRQIRRYLDNAHRSRLLHPLLERGARVRGVLATVETGGAESSDPEVSVRSVDRQRCIEVVKRLRRRGVRPTRRGGRKG